MRKILLFAALAALLLGCLPGCRLVQQPQKPHTGSSNDADEVGDTNDTNDTNDANDAGKDDAEPLRVDFSKTDEDMFTDRDRRTDYDTARAVAIRLDGDSAAADSGTVAISGSDVTITEEATYVISGTLNDGRLTVNAKDTAKVHLIFDGVTITSESGAALYILGADKVFITLADGTENTLANGGSFTATDDNNVDGAVFSKQDLTLNGGGSLTVTSPAGHGIVCKDDLVFTGGSYVIQSASHGLDANDSVRITGARLTIDAGKDAIHAENSDDATKGFVYVSGGSIQAEAEGDGISAGAYMHMADGTIDLLVGGGSENGTKEHSDSFGGFMGGGKPGNRPRSYQSNTTTEDASTSMKGLKATDSLLIAGGAITVNSADDAIHSNQSVILNGGTLTLASGDDAIHAEDTLTVIAGTVRITESYEGLEALHIDVRGGNITLKADDDGLNAAGGTDQSGTEGGRDGMFGGGFGGMGGPGGMGGNSNGSITISGGTLYVCACGDGIDANGTLEITGGHTTVTGPTQGDTAVLDYDRTAVITGGTFIGTGSTMMAQSFSDSEQGVIAINTGSQSAGTEIVIKDAKGKVVLSHKPELNFAIMIFSCPDLVKGNAYTVTIGNRSSEIQAN